MREGADDDGTRGVVDNGSDDMSEGEGVKGHGRRGG
jgi:hypothetical protein